MTATACLAAVIPMAILSLISYRESAASLERGAEQQLAAINERQAGAIEAYLAQIDGQIREFARNLAIVEAAGAFTAAAGTIPPE
ncbi:MAG: hypothetical protein ACOCXJ_05115, partial [Planctomycetota bacterium]